jgi:hypothetical protein
MTQSGAFAAPRNGLGIASLLIAIAALLLVWSVFGGVGLGTVAAAIFNRGRAGPDPYLQRLCTK